MHRAVRTTVALAAVLVGSRASAQAVATLRPVATLPAPPPDADVYRCAGGLVAIGDDATVFYALDAGTPRRTARVDGGRGAVLAAGDAVLRASGRAIERVDPATGAPLWRTDVGANASLAAAARDGDLVVITGGAGFEVLALNVVTGRLGPRREAAVSASTAAGNGLMFVLTPSSPLHAIERATGRTRWQQARPTAAASDTSLDFDAGHLVLAGPSGVSIVDPSRGAVVASNPLVVHAASTPPTASAGTLYVVSAVPGASGAALYAIDESTGQTRWRSNPVAAMGAVVAPAPHVGRDAVYACMPDGTLDAFDAATGRTLWSWGLGACREFAVVPSAAGDVVVAADAARGDVAVFAGGASVAPSAHVVVQGTLRIAAQNAGNTRVRVGPVVTRTDAHGHYRVALEARGAVSVEPDRDGAAVTGAPVTLALEGRARSYVVDADFSRANAR